MACKLLRKCRKEEALAGVIAVAVQCTKGVMFSWAPYLLNFLIDYMDAQDNGVEFHYSWLLVLIALVGLIRWISVATHLFQLAQNNLLAIYYILQFFVPKLLGAILRA
jgi:hypothetical protein